MPRHCFAGHVKIKPPSHRQSLAIGNFNSIELLPEMNWLQGPRLVGTTL